MIWDKTQGPRLQSGWPFNLTQVWPFEKSMTWEVTRKRRVVAVVPFQLTSSTEPSRGSGWLARPHKGIHHKNVLLQNFSSGMAQLLPWLTLSLSDKQEQYCSLLHLINKNKDINDTYSLGLMWGLNELRYTKQLELCSWDRCWWAFLYYDNETLPNDDHTCHVLSFCLAVWMPHLPKCFRERSPQLNEGGKPVSTGWAIFELLSLLVYLNDVFLPSVASPRGYTRDCNEPHAVCWFIQQIHRTALIGYLVRCALCHFHGRISSLPVGNSSREDQWV